MAKINSSCGVDFKIHFTLNESQARALDAIVGYGPDAFIEVFYPKMGKAYLEPHEDGLRSLFAEVRKELPAHLDKINETKKIWNNR